MNLVENQKPGLRMSLKKMGRRYDASDELHENLETRLYAGHEGATKNGLVYSMRCVEVLVPSD